MQVAALLTSALLGACFGRRSAPWEMPRLDLTTQQSKPSRRQENHVRRGRSAHWRTRRRPRANTGRLTGTPGLPHRERVLTRTG